MRNTRNNLKVIIAFIVGVILAGGIVYAAVTSADEVSYATNKNTSIKNVEEALNDLYAKLNKKSVQVATLTTQAASYTMQNDGYIVGIIKTLEYGGAEVYLTHNSETKKVVETDYRWPEDFEVSIYTPKGSTISTREDGGTYNLVVYEFK